MPDIDVINAQLNSVWLIKKEDHEKIVSVFLKYFYYNVKE